MFLKFKLQRNSKPNADSTAAILMDRNYFQQHRRLAHFKMRWYILLQIQVLYARPRKS